MAAEGRSRRVGYRRLLLGCAVVALVVVGGAGYFGAKASLDAVRGKRALFEAESSLRDGDVTAAVGRLQRAEQEFGASRRNTRSMLRLAPFAKGVPLVGSQVRALEALADTGMLLSRGGIELAGAAGSLLEPDDPIQPLGDSLDELRELQRRLRSGTATLGEAATRLSSLEGDRLIRPLGEASTDLLDRLPVIRSRAQAADDALAAYLTFVGAEGPQRYLVLVQNPDEVRPTGGFIGSYGVLTAMGGKLSWQAYDDTESWTSVRPTAVATPGERGSPLRFDTRVPQSLANVNTSPDWPSVAKLAMALWQRGGEPPVQGVLTYTPAFLADVLGVFGPVTVEPFGESVTDANLVERLDAHVAAAAAAPDSVDKEFFAAASRAVTAKLFEAPASQWEALAGVLGRSLSAREAMAWSGNDDLARVLAERRWDGAVPGDEGDFVYPAEFEYAAKNGRELRRIYDHQVTLRPDGSARITTKVTITNPSPVQPVVNPPDVPVYVTMFGPVGAKLDPSSDPIGVPEPAVTGHPGHGWFRSLAPQSSTTITVVWDVPAAARSAPDGSWEYSLRWMRLPDHVGDVLHLTVDLPDGWQWVGPAPPGDVPLDADVDGHWTLSTAR